MPGLQDESYPAYLDTMLFALPRPRRVAAPVLVLGAEKDGVFTKGRGLHHRRGAADRARLPDRGRDLPTHGARHDARRGGGAAGLLAELSGLRAGVFGQASMPTVWPALAEAGQVQLARVNAAVTGFRRYWWILLADRPRGFPWLKIAGRQLTGITVVDSEA